MLWAVACGATVNGMYVRATGMSVEARGWWLACMWDVRSIQGVVWGGICMDGGALLTNLPEVEGGQFPQVYRAPKFFNPSLFHEVFFLLLTVESILQAGD